jgi:hypothetical protein
LLLQIHDKARPYDSVHYKASASIDSAGGFEFPGVRYGHYLIRVHVDPYPGSSGYSGPLHNYYGDGLIWDQAGVFIWKGGDTSLPINLFPPVSP